MNDTESEILAMAEVAKKKKKKYWNGSLRPPDCQSKSVSTLLNVFVSLLLNGCCMKDEKNLAESQITYYM